MDDTLLLDAIERYRNGEMSPNEITFFEELRKNNPEIDQLVVEHTAFLNQLEKHGEIAAFRQQLHEAENKLTREGVISADKTKGKSAVVYLWTRYKKIVGVAAAIAGFVSLSTATFVSKYSSEKKVQEDIQPLVDRKINAVTNRLKQLETQMTIASSANKTAHPKPAFEANFRATGFLIDGSGYLVTNAHVVDNARNIIVENKKGEQFIATAIYADKPTDLAILKITDTSFRKVTGLPYTFSKNTSELGEHIYTLGYPREEIVYSEGYLSAQSGYSGDTTEYQVSMSVNPGNSGGPVINKNGEVIGIISSKETNADGVVFAIKSKNIYTALKQLNDSMGIKLPAVNTLKNLDRMQQIPKLEDYVYMVKGN
ncbi:MAG TPA: serine protease [Chitinophagaceae bacterium]|nr:serine protease [Chitinophagaceae bacterium]